MTREEQCLLLYNEHPNLIRYLTKIGCSFHDAEEIIQTIQERILGGKLNIKNTFYFYTAAKNKYIRIKKKRKREILTSKNVWFENNITKEEFNNNENSIVINNAIKSLPIKTQIAIKMLYWKNRSRKDIANTLGISESGVKNVIQRGKAKIKKYLLENE